MYYLNIGFGSCLLHLMLMPIFICEYISFFFGFYLLQLSSYSHIVILFSNIDFTNLWFISVFVH